MSDLLTKMPSPCELKKENKFIVRFPKSFNIQEWTVASTSRPSMYFKKKNYLKLRFKDKIIWKPISIILRDPIGPSTSQPVFKLINQPKVFNLVLEMLDPIGGAVEKWELKTCTIKSIDFGNLDYDSDNVVNIKIDINISDAKLIF